MAQKRKIIKIDEELCDGCEQCTIACAEGALKIIDGKAKVISDNLCDGLGACIGDCPTGALTIIERVADEFDEEAVEKHLESKKDAAKKSLPCGCPSAHIQSFEKTTPCQSKNMPASISSTEALESNLSHWPIKIKLIPPSAPFLKNADLMVVADCVPVAFPNLNDKFLDKKAIMIGCPKFDDADSYIEKFTEIFNTANLNSITCLFMEVPCCFGLPAILDKAMDQAKTKIPIEKIKISTRGKVISDTSK